MSVDSPQPGEITLHGLVSLENRHPAPGKPNTYIYDVIFSCSGQTTDGIASCRHYIGQDRTKKLDDVYDVRAKVRQCFLSSLPFSHGFRLSVLKVAAMSIVINTATMPSICWEKFVR